MNLNGGAGDDYFIFGSNAVLTGAIDGGADSNILDYTAYTTDVTVNIAAGTSTGTNGIANIEIVDGGRGTNTIIGDENDNILYGGSSNDILIGGGGNDTYIIHDNWGTDTIVEMAGGGNDTLLFSHVSALTGIVTFTFGPTTFTVTGGGTLTGSGIENFIGGDFGNNFVLQNGAVVAGNISGGSGGHNNLDFSGYNAPRHVNLTGIGTLNGFKGQEAAIVGTFDNINALIGSTQPGDSLTGLNVTSTWNLAGGTSGSYTALQRTLTLSGVDLLLGNNSADTFNISSHATLNLNGGAGNDTFAFADHASFTGTLDGGLGTDILDYSAYTSSLMVDLSSNSAAHVTGSVSNIENISGGSAADTLTGDSGNNVINGNGGNDTLAGGAGDDTYLFIGNWGQDIVNELANAGSDTLDFSTILLPLTVSIHTASLEVTGGANSVNHFAHEVEIVLAGSAADTFAFDNGATYAGTLDGGSGLDDTLTFSAYTLGRQVVLTGVGTLDGFNGYVTDTLGAFKNMNILVGSSAGDDQLVGANTPSVWTIDGTYRYFSGNPFDFSAIENLLGGSAIDCFDILGTPAINLNGGAGDDIFVFAGNDTLLTGDIDGGPGSDTLDFSALTISRRIRFTNYASNDGFVGVDSSRVPVMTGSFSHINGIIGSSDPVDPDVLVGLDRSAQWKIGDSNSYHVNPTLSFAGFEQLTGGSGEDTFDVSGVHDVALVGGAGDDIFILKDQAQVAVINGAGGTDIIEYYAFNAPIAYNPANGVATGVSNGYNGVESFIKTYPPLPPPPPPPVISTTEYRQRIVQTIVSLPWIILPASHGNLPIDITCQTCGGVILSLEDGNRIFLGVGNGSQASLTTIQTLPASLPQGFNSIHQMTVQIFQNGQQLSATSGYIQVSFALPACLKDADIAILFWDETLNDGMGGWVEVDFTMLAAQASGDVDRVQAWTKRTGTYLLVVRGAAPCSGGQ
jgi:Ca2+-binding RTX toxin-like protein